MYGTHHVIANDLVLAAFRKQIEKDKPEAILEYFDFFFALARSNDANTLKSLLEAFDALITGPKKV